MVWLIAVQFSLKLFAEPAGTEIRIFKTWSPTNLTMERSTSPLNWAQAWSTPSLSPAVLQFPTKSELPWVLFGTECLWSSGYTSLINPQSPKTSTVPASFLAHEYGLSFYVLSSDPGHTKTFVSSVSYSPPPLKLSWALHVPLLSLFLRDPPA
jgi:hypothetical protein